jgi:hypothetical protein
MSTRYVWAAVLWIGRLKGWEVEDGSEEWVFDVREVEGRRDTRGKVAVDKGVESGGKIWTVRTLERNWARFMRLDQR